MTDTNSKAVTHDYTARYWGHDFTFAPLPGSRGSMSGWGEGLKAGDYLLLPHNEGGTTRYVIDKIEYYRDPRDMWHATVSFAPRTPEQKGNAA